MLEAVLITDTPLEAVLALSGQQVSFFPLVRTQLLQALAVLVRPLLMGGSVRPRGSALLLASLVGVAVAVQGSVGSLLGVTAQVAVVVPTQAAAGLLSILL